MVLVNVRYRINLFAEGHISEQRICNITCPILRGILFEFEKISKHKGYIHKAAHVIKNILKFRQQWSNWWDSE